MTSRVVFSIGSSSDSDDEAADVIDSNSKFYVDSHLDLFNVRSSFRESRDELSVLESDQDVLKLPPIKKGGWQLFGAGRDVTQTSAGDALLYRGQRRRSRSKSPEMTRLIEKIRERRRTSAPELISASHLFSSATHAGVNRKMSMVPWFDRPPVIRGTLTVAPPCSFHVVECCECQKLVRATFACLRVTASS